MSEPKIFKSVHKPDAFGLSFESLGHAVCARLDRFAERVLIVEAETGKEWTGAELKRRILNVAACLRDKLAFEVGSFVCIFHEYTVETTILSMGVICAGGSVVSMDELVTYREVLDVAHRTKLKYWFSAERKLEYADRLGTDLGYQLPRVAMDGVGLLNKPYAHIKHFLDCSSAGNNLPVACRDKHSDVAIIAISSGTTGLPKSVPVTHAVCLQDIRDKDAPVPAPVLACSAPLDYVTGRLLFLMGISSGLKMVVIRSLDAAITFPLLIDRFKINLAYLGANALYSFVSSPKLNDYDISSLDVLFVAGAKVTYANALKAFFGAHPHVRRVQVGYGTTETAGVTGKFVSPADYLDDPNNTGPLAAGSELKVVDAATGALLAANKEGMLHVRTVSLFPGYYDASRGEQCSAFARDGFFDDDGFYITGDLGLMTHNEELYVSGRARETMTCRNALKVLPYELEACVKEHPAVAQVCVLGIQNELHPALQKPRAFVVVAERAVAAGFKPLYSSPDYKAGGVLALPRRGEHTLCKTLATEVRRAIELDIMAHVKERVSDDKQLIGGLIVLDEIPTLARAGKADKRRLRALTVDSVEIFGELPE